MNLGATYVYIAAFIELLLCAATILNPKKKTVFFFLRQKSLSSWSLYFNGREKDIINKIKTGELSGEGASRSRLLWGLKLIQLGGRVDALRKKNKKL